MDLSLIVPFYNATKCSDESFWSVKRFFDRKLKVSQDLGFKFRTVTLAESVSDLESCTYIFS